MDKVALVAAAILASIWVIMWLDLPPVLNSPLPAGQQVVVVIGQKTEKPVGFSNEKVIQSVPDPELATVKDITSAKLNSGSSASNDASKELPGWLKVTKKVSVEKASSKTKFVRPQDIAKFPKLVEAIAMADLKTSYRLAGIYDKTASLTETLEVDSLQARELIEFMEGKRAEVLEGKEYTWNIMFGMSVYTIQMKISQSNPMQ